MSTQAFVCPRCGAARFHVAASMELGPGDYDDERSVQLARCDGCAWRGLALYEESRRGADERVHHEAYTHADRGQYERAILGCAQPHDAACRCASHEAMREAVTTRRGFEHVGRIARPR